MKKEEKRALIVVDMQNDFCEGGSLEVNGSLSIIPKINKLIKMFDIVIFTMDWHPQNMKAFASNNHDKNPFESYINPQGEKDILWTDHCVVDTDGAKIHDDINILSVENSHYIFKKGTDENYHPYSGFGSDGLSEFLKEKNISHNYIVGLALDYCVIETAVDSIDEGFDTTVIVDATKSISTEGRYKAYKTMSEKRIKTIHSFEL